MDAEEVKIMAYKIKYYISKHNIEAAYALAEQLETKADTEVE